MVKYKILKEDECKNGLVGAILLKWIKEGCVELSKTKGGLFSLKDNAYAITFKNIDTSELIAKNEFEKDLMRIFKSASGDNNVLEVNFLEFGGIYSERTMERF